ncbi:MAG TPA: Rieske 2Fe-2S domain-containing protein [Chloroflexota bacterium]|jgi:nitrite reductase/ring-hydroxylating ferredoxin subunit
MSTTERLCPAADIAENSLQRITVLDELQDEVDVCVTRLNGQVYAVIDRCGHMNAPMSRGELQGDVVSCPVHHAEYSLITGKLLRPADDREDEPGRRPRWGGLRPFLKTLPLERLKVSERDGAIFVELP